MYRTVEELIVKNYQKLNETDLQIWQTIKQVKHEERKFTIDSIASAANVSRTTISRFVKKLNLSGFSEFKFLINLEKDDPILLGQRVYEDTCDSIIRYVEEQKKRDYEQVCELIYRAENIYVYGTGDIQNSVAKQLKRMFISCKEKIFDIGGTTFDLSLYEMIQPEDVMIIISLSGENEKAVEIARNLKLKNVRLISITELKNNQLADLCDESLYISAKKFKFLKEHPNYRFINLYFILIELLFIKYSIYKNNKLKE